MYLDILLVMASLSLREEVDVDVKESDETSTPIQPLSSPQKTSAGAFKSLTWAPSGRPYLTWQSMASFPTEYARINADHRLAPPGKKKVLMGVLIPDGYKLHPDPTYPYVCPVRTCRKLFSTLPGVDLHFYVSHPYNVYSLLPACIEY